MVEAFTGNTTAERVMTMKKRYAQIAVMALCFSFLLGIKNGKVALWNQDDPNQVKVFPYPVSRLPKEARDALEKGVELESEQQLYDMVRDYLN